MELGQPANIAATKLGTRLEQSVGAHATPTEPVAELGLPVITVAIPRHTGTQRRLLLVVKSRVGEMARFVLEEPPVMLVATVSSTGTQRQSLLVAVSHAGVLAFVVALEQPAIIAAMVIPTGGRSCLLAATKRGRRISTNLMHNPALH